MRLTGVDNATALLDAATAKLGRLQGASAKASNGLAAAAGRATKALLFTGPLAALRSLRRGLIAATAAAAGLAYATDRAANRFGTLSDQAAQAGATADEITRISLALRTAGVRAASVDQLATALGRMAKETGRTGLAGLRATLADIAAMPDEAARVTALIDTFGRSLGPQFAALVRQGPDALIEGLDGVVAAMPGVSNSVVESGDAIADGMLTIRESIRTGWDSMLVSMADAMAKHFGAESFRELGARISAYVNYYTNIAINNLGPLWDHLKFWGANLPRIFVAGINDIGDAIQTAIVERLGLVGKLLHLQMTWGSELGQRLGLAAKTLNDGGDLESAWEAMLDGPAKRTGSHIGEVLGEYTGRAWAGATDEAALALVNSLVASAKLEDSMSKLATGAAAPFEEATEAADELGEAGVAAAKKTAEAWKGPSAIMANSYDALRLSMQKTARAASSLIAGASSSSSRSAVSGGDLATLLQVQRDGWSSLQSSLAALGVV